MRKRNARNSSICDLFTYIYFNFYKLGEPKWKVLEAACGPRVLVCPCRVSVFDAVCCNFPFASSQNQLQIKSLFRFQHSICIPVMCFHARPRSDPCMTFNAEAKDWAGGLLFLLGVSSLTQLQCCVVLVLCTRLFFFLSASGIGMFYHRLCPTRTLIGPGLPSPTDAAPPTTAQCIRPAAPRDCPRTSLSLFPRSSSLVRRQGTQRERGKKTKQSKTLSYIQKEVNSVVSFTGWTCTFPSMFAWQPQSLIQTGF